MRFKPGEQWVYNDACAMLTGAIIEQASGKKLSEFAEETLFAPLGIRKFYWYTGVGGRTGAMGNVYLSTLDFAKIGLLMLNQGTSTNKDIPNHPFVLLWYMHGNIPKAGYLRQTHLL